MYRRKSHNHPFLDSFVVLLVTVLMIYPAVSVPGRPQHLADVSKRIRSEAFEHSRIMDYAFYLTDVYGPRLTGSSNYRAAAEWVEGELKRIGLSSIAKEPIPGFRYGWVNTRFSLSMTEPSFAPLIGAPLAWSTGTRGEVEGEAIRIDLPEQSLQAVTQFTEKNRGKLRGRILLARPPSVLKLHATPRSTRWSDDEIAELVANATTRSTTPAQGPPRDAGRIRLTRAEVMKINDTLANFFAEEGALAIIGDFGNPTLNDGGTFSVERAFLQGPQTIRPGMPPTITMAAEHYNRLVRLVEKGIPVRLRLDVGVSLIDRTSDAFNLIAEIPGGKKKDEFVIVGAHLDSWTGGTGATDNAGGCAVVMEVARIFKKLALPLSRTVRFALWGGEEQGTEGSRAYVKAHLKDPDSGAVKPEYEKFSTYYNLDEGTGRLRAVRIGDNLAARPLIEEWLNPTRDLGAIGVLLRPGAGSDDASFAAIGLPSFSFLHDPLEFRTRTLHTNMDVYDRLQEDDLKQAAVVLATLVYADANRDAPMPRPGR